MSDDEEPEVSPELSSALESIFDDDNDDVLSEGEMSALGEAIAESEIEFTANP